MRRLAVGVALALGIGSCGHGTPGNAERKILRIAYDREIDVLNPFTSQNLVDIQFSMMEGLVTTDDHNRYVPVLATEIPTEDNGLVVRNADGTVDMTWPLHAGVRWHDGVPFTSADVCFTWRFVTSPGSQVYNRDQYLGIVGCDAPDEHTVVFHWNGQYAYYAGLFEAILPEHVLEGMTTDEIVNYTPFNRGSAFVGTGPFRFAEWRSGEYIRVVKNDHYWRGPDVPRIDEIVWSFVPDANTRLNAMRARQYHYAQLLPTQVSEVKGLEGYQVHLVSSNTFMHLDLSLNTQRSRAIFGDPRVRQALFHAVDRRAIAGKLMQGTVKVADSPINPSSPFHDPRVPSVSFDPALARRMLDEAGWHPGPDGIREKDGRRLTFTMVNRAGSADRIAVAQVIQAELKDVGAEVTFETLESAAWTQRWRSGQWEAVVSAWFLPADPSITGLYACEGPNNMTGLCDPALDEVMEASDRALDPERRRALLFRAQEMLAASARTLPLYYNVIPQLVSTDVGNFKPSGTNFGSFWNLWEWTLAMPGA
ncbi:MAG: peptide ABC transporter substrate-binding protein [Gemmatimonadota bacterium]|jgi:peptide/nickel transport system substrate-binding protein